MSAASASRRAALLRRHWAGPSALRAQRLAAGLTLDELAQRSGVRRQTIIAAEAGEPIADAHWFRLAAALRVDARWLRPAEDRDALIRAATGGFDTLGFSE